MLGNQKGIFPKMKSTYHFNENHKFLWKSRANFLAPPALHLAIDK